jgi:phosphohistidine phosphatase SixA
MSVIRHAAMVRHCRLRKRNSRYELSKIGREEAAKLADEVWKWVGDDQLIVLTAHEGYAKQTANIIANGRAKVIEYDSANIYRLIPICEDEFWDDVPEGTHVVCITHEPTMANVWGRYFYGLVDFCSGWRSYGGGVFLEIDLSSHTVLKADEFVQEDLFESDREDPFNFYITG